VWLRRRLGSGRVVGLAEAGRMVLLSLLFLWRLVVVVRYPRPRRCCLLGACGGGVGFFGVGRVAMGFSCGGDWLVLFV